ncbi:hypothetical protein BKA67DRAFT_593451 [Truncatella angustata]|uniref:Uncharacterized protein n=1 Tax=Truncatella angustata TaxID=152316 RepID=A0A9P8UGA8_9PEZI|nr:uncharacterized protein BKA67DRAFT_593451 [Truncatella angustata]KAH6651574.1 hypothetical protein BKA67DRAFT_593451 [Truncatella angustata]
MAVVRSLRNRRAQSIESGFSQRPLSSMTTQEAFNIMQQLQELEFPSAMNKARRIALLKAGGISTMSKLFAVTGQNNTRNAGKRAVDTEILLREVQSQPRDSERYQQSVARMNYFHQRYRQAGKILDEDLLHTLGDNVVEIFRILDGSEWRRLGEVEKCAIGIFHKHLGEDMLIPFTPLPSSEQGWKDGLHFATELRGWTIEYEKRVAEPSATNDQYVRVYVDGATARLPRAITMLLRKTLGFELDDTMRKSLNLESPGFILSSILFTYQAIRKVLIRNFCLPRPSLFAVKAVENDNTETGFYNFPQVIPQPWYVKPTFWSMWGPAAILFRALGGRAPGSMGDRYHPQGYNLWTIGPKPQEGKGRAEMAAAIDFMKTRGSTGCPFSHKTKGT